MESTHFETSCATTQTCTIISSRAFDLHSIFKWDIDSHVIYMKFDNTEKGQHPHPKKNTKTRFFKNSLTMIFSPEPSRLINIKISTNGTLQLTGCKYEKEPVIVLDYLWNKFDHVNISSTIIWCMTNISFALNHSINKDNLREILNSTPFEIIQINEPCYSYAGLNCKIPLSTKDLGAQKILYCDYLNGVKTIRRGCYTEYLETLTPRDKTRKIKQHYISFLAFSSGKFIMSGTTLETVTFWKNLLIDFLNQKCSDVINV